MARFRRPTSPLLLPHLVALPLLHLAVPSVASCRQCRQCRHQCLPAHPPTRTSIPPQAGCPAVVHVIDTVLLPDIIEEPTLWESLATIWATGGAVGEDKVAPISLLA